MSGNCTDTLPVSEVFIQEVTVAEKAGIGISTVLCVGVLALFFDKAYFIYRYYGNYGTHLTIKHKSLILVAIYPVTAVTSLMAIYIPRSKYFCEFLSNVYLSVCLYQFMSLMVLYFGGRAELLQKISTTGFGLRAPPVCCCCSCCPVIKASARNLYRLQLMVLQAGFVQPLVCFVSMLLWLDGKYTPGVTSATSSATYLTTASMVSTLVAMYGLLVVFRASRPHLVTHSLSPKFLALQLVLVVQDIQRFVFNILADSGIPPCRQHLSSSVRADGLQNMLVIGEMFLLALAARVVYRKPTRQQLTQQALMSPDDDDDDTGDRGRAMPSEGGRKLMVGDGVQSYGAVDDGDLPRSEDVEGSFTFPETDSDPDKSGRLVDLPRDA